MGLAVGERLNGTMLGGDRRERRLLAVDLFSGSGAVTAGLSAGFEVIAAVDHDPIACRTYSANHPGGRLFQRDVEDLDPTEILEEVPEAHDVDLLVVCAPCQPFSNQNRRKGNDLRAGLVLQAARYAAALQPRGIFFENVPGLAGAAGVYQELVTALDGVGYRVGRPRKVDAADLGVPQRRVRCVMFAARTAEAVALFEGAEMRAPRRTVAQAIRGLKPLRSGETDPSDRLHAARQHSPVALQRLQAAG